MEKIIKIFCMQKNESDILSQWIEYHSKIVCYENIYIIDNESTDNSLEILNKFKQEKGINVCIRTDYQKKGDYICELINQNPCDMAIPLDLDEFIGINEDYNNIEKIKEELFRLIDLNCPKYSFSNYLTSVNTKLYYNNPIEEIEYYSYVNVKSNNKKFFNGKYKLLSLDHGNHTGKIENCNENDYYVTKLFLFHFHYRGLYKLIEKCKNDILGLNKNIKNINDILELKNLLKMKQLGYHNLETYIKFLEDGPYSLLMHKSDKLIKYKFKL